LKRPGEKPKLFIKKRDEIALSGKLLTGLMSDILNRGLPFRFRTKGDSMIPFIKDGDLVTVFPIKGSLMLGDIGVIVNRMTDNPVVHRIVGIKEEGYIIKGDAVLTPDGLFPAEQILGVVKRIERSGRRRRCGLGIDRTLIALLSRKNIFYFYTQILNRKHSDLNGLS
jgi:signal peptidase I